MALPSVTCSCIYTEWQLERIVIQCKYYLLIDIFCRRADVTLFETTEFKFNNGKKTGIK